MNFFSRILSRETVGTDVLRLVLCAILFTHGFYRLSHGEAPGLGAILRDEGVPAANLVAYLVCLAETGGTLLLALRLLIWPVAAILTFIYFTGIMMFHRHAGFFVVGPGEGGWEYSALIIACLFVTAWQNRSSKFF